MAQFAQAFEKTVSRWERFELTDHPGDHGRQTYAGISRRFWGSWPGWELIDQGRPVPQDLVRAFYRAQFWDAIEGNALQHQDVAEIIFDWAVNAGVGSAVRLTLYVLDLPTDLGMQRALPALNSLSSPRLFVCEYALQRVAHRAQVIQRDPTQAKWIEGWLNRDLFFTLGDT